MLRCGTSNSERSRRQRDVLNSAITQLELEVAGVVGDDRSAVASRERLSSDITDKKVQLQELDQLAAQGSNIYSFGNAQSFQAGQGQLAVLVGVPSVVNTDC